MAMASSRSATEVMADMSPAIARPTADEEADHVV
jgi:hypothetical protein